MSSFTVRNNTLPPDPAPFSIHSNFLLLLPFGETRINRIRSIVVLFFVPFLPVYLLLSYSFLFNILFPLPSLLSD
jgi:hypothetical protein